MKTLRPYLTLFLVFFGMLGSVSSLAETVLVPAGTLKPFWIEPKKRSNKEGRPELVSIRPFRSDKTAVTNQEFMDFMKSHPRWAKDEVSPLFADATYLEQFEGAKLRKGVPAEGPATFVSWFAAKAFCESRGMRLPTVAEWEYMASASKTVRDASRDPEFLATILEWYSQPRSEGWVPKGPGSANLYGVKDLHGSIWEWVEDFNSTFATGESREDGSFNRDLFCGAGNMAGGNKENYAAFMRFAFRASLTGRSSVWNLGFRCVQEAQL